MTDHTFDSVCDPTAGARPLDPAAVWDAVQQQCAGGHGQSAVTAGPDPEEPWSLLATAFAAAFLFP